MTQDSASKLQIEWCEQCKAPSGYICHYQSGCLYESDKKMIQANIEKIFDEIPADCQETGSRYICNPPVLNTDEDWIFNCSGPGQMEETVKILEGYGFYILDMNDGDYDDIRENFTSYRLGDLNFILCNNETFYKKFVLATQVAAELNLLKKADRILLFQAMLYGKIHGEEYL